MPSQCRLLREVSAASLWVITTVLLLVVGVPSVAANDETERPRHPVRRVTSDITIDGRVIEDGPLTPGAARGAVIDQPRRHDWRQSRDGDRRQTSQ